jgi:hypothetical protein
MSAPFLTLCQREMLSPSRYDLYLYLTMDVSRVCLLRGQVVVGPDVTLPPGTRVAAPAASASAPAGTVLLVYADVYIYICVCVCERESLYV